MNPEMDNYVTPKPVRGELVYLACPYSHDEHSFRMLRWYAANQAAAKLMSEGLYIFSPISHTHPIAEASEGKLPRGWDFWEGYDRQYLNICKKIIVLRIPGWDTSKGVQAEIKIGTEMGIPIEYMDWDICKAADAFNATFKRT